MNLCNISSIYSCECWTRFEATEICFYWRMLGIHVSNGEGLEKIETMLRIRKINWNFSGISRGKRAWKFWHSRIILKCYNKIENYVKPWSPTSWQGMAYGRIYKNNLIHHCEKVTYPLIWAIKGKRDVTFFF